MKMLDRSKTYVNTYKDEEQPPESQLNETHPGYSGTEKKNNLKDYLQYSKQLNNNCNVTSLYKIVIQIINTNINLMLISFICTC